MIKLNGKEVIFETFPNGETLFKKDQLDIRSHNVVSFKFDNDSDFIKLLLLKKEIDIALGEMGHRGLFKKTILEMAYYPYSRMDRGSKTIAFTLKTVAEFINTLHFDKVVINEPHSKKCVELTLSSKDSPTTIKLFQKIRDEIGFNPEKDYILFPDKGAKERYDLNFWDGEIKEERVLTADKTRDFETGHIKDLIIEGKIENNAKVVILDDLSSYGGTFIWSADKLKAIGAGEIYLVVTHAEEAILEGKIPNSELITGVFCTDSIIKHSPIDKIKVYNWETV